jgi:hypothetical protein
LQAGYSLPADWASKISMRSVHIFLSAENPASWSPLYKRTKDFDVMTATSKTDSDLDSSYNQGEGNSYPLMKSLSLGVSLMF